MNKITKAVIPAAGFGTRFLPATKAQPKEMLTVVDKPVIQYIVEEAVAAGIKDIIIITGQSKRAIEDHFDRGFELELRLKEQKKTKVLKEIQKISKLANFIYVRQKEMLGDGHAILQAASLVKNEPFAVMFGDDIIDSPTPTIGEMIKIYEEFTDPVICLSQVPKKEVSKYGVIDGQKLRPNLHQISRFVEKPSPDKTPSNLVAVGRYIITPELMFILKKTPRPKNGELRLANAFIQYLKKHPIYGYAHEGDWHSCGDKLGFLKATVSFALQHPELKKEFIRYLKSI